MRAFATDLFIFIAALVLLQAIAQAEDFPKLDEALPSGVNISTIYPVFDFEKDGCFPSAGVDRRGKANVGQGIHHRHCRRTDFMKYSNTYHRYACFKHEKSRYCGHFFSIYTMVDKIAFAFPYGHHHDWENVILWTKDGDLAYGSYSKHAGMGIATAEKIPPQDGHPKFVYHKGGVRTSSIRLARFGEMAENSYGKFVTPTIVSWYTMKGDNVSNAYLRKKFNTIDYGRAHVPHRDARFLSALNNFKPKTFPEFPESSVESSK